MLIRFKIGKDKYEIDEDDLTTGEAYLLKRDYGLGDFGDLSYKDPEVMLGLKAIAILRRHPEMAEPEARAKAEAHKDREIFEDLTKQFEKIIADAEAKAAEDPPLPAGSASTADGAPGGKATPPRSGGARRSASTA